MANVCYGITPVEQIGSQEVMDGGQKYSYVNPHVTTEAPGLGETYAQLVKKSLTGNKVADVKAEDDYDRLAVQPGHKAASPLSAVSPGDITYVNCEKTTVVSSYDHVIFKERHDVKNSYRYDHVDIADIRHIREPDTSSLYNHVTEENDK